MNNIAYLIVLACFVLIPSSLFSILFVESRRRKEAACLVLILVSILAIGTFLYLHVCVSGVPITRLYLYGRRFWTPMLIGLSCLLFGMISLIVLRRKR